MDMNTLVPINYLAVLIAAVWSVILGSFWYGPLFGKQWMKLSNIKMPKTMTPEMKKMMMKSYILTIVGGLVMSFVLAHALVFASAYMHVEGVSAGLMAGIWNWLGFIVPASLTSVLWEGKPWKMWFINNGYWLVLLSTMGVILAVWR